MSKAVSIPRKVRGEVVPHVSPKRQVLRWNHSIRTIAAQCRGHSAKRKQFLLRVTLFSYTGESGALAMGVEYGDITSAEAVAFCFADPAKAREDTLGLTQVRRESCCFALCVGSAPHWPTLWNSIVWYKNVLNVDFLQEKGCVKLAARRWHIAKHLFLPCKHRPLKAGSCQLQKVLSIIARSSTPPRCMPKRSENKTSSWWITTLCMNVPKLL